MKWKVQDLGANRVGYPDWHEYAIRDAETNVHIATVGNVDRYYERNGLQHAELIAAAPTADTLLRGCIGWLNALPEAQKPDPQWMAPLWDYLKDHRNGA